MNDMVDVSNIKIDIDRLMGATITIKRDNGIESIKECSVDSIQQVFTKEIKMITGMLPPGCRWYGREKNFESVLIESPPSIRKVSYSSNGKFFVPTPWTLWKFCLSLEDANNPVVRGSRAWAMKDPIIPGKEDSHVLYNFPFCNVHSNCGSICWGGSSTTSKSMHNVKDISTVGKLIDLFWSADFNGDLDHNFNSFHDESHNYVSSSLNLFRYLDGKTEFKYDILQNYSNVLEQAKMD